MKVRIKEVAKQKGYSLIKLGEKTGIDSTTLSRYNTGVIEPPLSRLEIIAEALDCDVIELLTPGENYWHFHVNGKWEGIRKK